MLLSATESGEIPSIARAASIFLSKVALLLDEVEDTLLFRLLAVAVAVAVDSVLNIEEEEEEEDSDDGTTGALTVFVFVFVFVFAFIA